MSGLAARPPPPPFDQNDKKYFHVFGKLHVLKASRIVACLYIFCIALNLLYIVTRSLTAAFFALISGAFSVVIFGALIYGVFKEKRLYVVPYLVFQAISIALTALFLFIFIIAIGVNSGTVVELAETFAGVDPRTPQEEFNRAMAIFTVLFIIYLCVAGFIQAYFLEIIYCFYHFLKDRESSFTFNFDTTISYGAQPDDIFTNVDTSSPPAYDNHLEELK